MEIKVSREKALILFQTSLMPCCHTLFVLKLRITTNCFALNIQWPVEQIGFLPCNFLKPNSNYLNNFQLFFTTDTLDDKKTANRQLLYEGISAERSVLAGSLGKLLLIF